MKKLNSYKAKVWMIVLIILMQIILLVLNVIRGNALTKLSFATDNSDTNTDKIHFLALGDSDSILIESNGHYGLIDTSNPSTESWNVVPDGCGDYRSSSYNGKKVATYLNDLGVKELDFIVGTHSHSDHIGGILDICNAKQYLESATGETVDFITENTTYIYKKYNLDSNVTPEWNNEGYYNWALNAVENDGAKLLEVQDHSDENLKQISNDAKFIDNEENTNDYIEFTFENYNIKIFNIYTVSTREENVNSLVILITKGDTKTLLMADMNVWEETEQKIAKYVGEVDLIKIGHHGHEKSTSIELLNETKPKMSVVTTSGWEDNLDAVSHFLKENSGKLYLTSNANKAIVAEIGISDINLKTYDESGELSIEPTTSEASTTGWLYSYVNYTDKTWLYVDSEAKSLVKGWKKIAYNGTNYWFYFAEENSEEYCIGEMVTGLQKIVYNDKECSFYFSETATDDYCIGAMTSGWQQLNYGKKTYWFYFSKTATDDFEYGEMVTGWKQLTYNGESCWFYFSEEETEEYCTGEMVTGCQNIDGTEYYFDSNGVMRTKETTWDLSNTEEDNVTAILYDDGTLAITGTGAMKDWNYNNADVAEWHGKIKNIKKVIIEEGVTNIGDRMFMYCQYITSVNLPKSIENIGIYAFNNCTNLQTITINSYFKLDSSINVFIHSSNLTKLIIGKDVEEFNTSLFSSLEYLTTIEIDEGNTNFKLVDNILYNSDVTELIGCPQKRTGEVNIPNTVKNIRAIAFQGCEEITKVTIPDSVETMGQSVFNICKSLTEITIPGSIKHIPKYTFMQCDNLESVILQEGVESIAFGAFQSSPKLELISIPSTVNEIDKEAFIGLENIKNFDVSEDNEKFCSENGILYNKGKTILIRYTTGSENKSFTIPDNVKEIGNQAFRDSSNLESVQLNNFITEIPSGCFFLASKLKEINNSDNLEYIGDSAFRKCTSLESFVIPENVTKLGGAVFLYCENLQKVEILGNLKSMGNGVFRGCEKLVNITIPQTLEKMGTKVFENVPGPVNYYSNNQTMRTYALNNAEETQYNDLGEKTVTKIEITAEPSKKTYLEGQKFDEAGMIVTATYNDGDTTIITDYTVTNGDSLSLGQTSVIISYTENEVTKTVEQNITVEAKYLESIEVEKAPNKTTYIEGEKFDETGMIVTAIYNNGTTKKITNYTVTNGDSLSLGQTSVTISYTENEVTKTVEQNITVEAKTLESIKVTKVPSKTTYIEGEKFDETGMVVTATYNNGITKEITDYTVTNGESLSLEQTTVTISYTENEVTKTVEQNITVEAKTLESIKVTKVPSKTTYIEGEKFDETGMVITAIYNNETTKEITDYTVTNGESLSLGQTSVTISYTENGITKEVMQEITVNAKEVLSVEIAEYDLVASEDGNYTYIQDLKINNSIEELLENITTNGEIKVYQGETEIADKTKKIATGMKIKITLNEESKSYVLIVTGDVNGDAKADLKDILAVNRHRLNKVALDRGNLLAGDVNEDGKVDLNDILQINRFRLGKLNSL